MDTSIYLACLILSYNLHNGRTDQAQSKVEIFVVSNQQCSQKNPRKYCISILQRRNDEKQRFKEKNVVKKGHVECAFFSHNFTQIKNLNPIHSV